MKNYFLNKDRFFEFLEILKSLGAVYWAREKEITSVKDSDKKITIERLDESYIKDYKIPQFRSYEIFKPFLLPLSNKVAEYPDDKWKEIEDDVEKTILLGLKGCDLNGIEIIDRIFLEDPEFIDPFYKKRRESLILISSDCMEARESCFCNLLDYTPYATDNFDINISEISGGYIFESGSEVGEKILEDLSLAEATDKHLKERDNNREKILNDLKKQNSGFKKSFSDLHKLIDNGYESDEGWALGSTCVSCGACTNVCPVCYCFTLFDRMEEEGDKAKRFMIWDSCQLKGFSQMAGGMNPRFPMLERFKNRYYHKFFRFHERYDIYKCTGCGRCIDNCLGDIDMREVIAGIKT